MAISGQAEMLTSDLLKNLVAKHPIGHPLAGQPLAVQAHVEDLLEAMEARFRPPAASDLEKAAFADALQAADEDVMHWSSRIRSLYERAYPNVPFANLDGDPHLIDKFTQGLHDREVRGRVMERRDNTLQAATNRALNVVAAKRNLERSDRGRSDEQRRSGIHSISSGSISGRSGEDSRDVAAIRKGDRKEKKNLDCLYCGKRGHKIVDCFHMQSDRERFRKYNSSKGGRDGASRDRKGSSSKAGWKNKKSGDHEGRNKGSFKRRVAEITPQGAPSGGEEEEEWASYGRPSGNDRE